MENLPDISTLADKDLQIAAIGAIAVGGLYTFFGYRLLKFIIGLSGFLLAGAAGVVIAGIATQDNQWAMIFGGILAGVAGAIALFMLYKTGVFLLGVLAAGLIVRNALAASTADWAPWAMIAIAIAGGLFALAAERPLMSLATAAIGAWIIVCGTGVLVMGRPFLDAIDEPINLREGGWILLACWAVLTLAGAIAQYTTTPRRGMKEREAEG